MFAVYLQKYRKITMESVEKRKRWFLRSLMCNLPKPYIYVYYISKRLDISNSQALLYSLPLWVPLADNASGFPIGASSI